MKLTDKYDEILGDEQAIKLLYNMIRPYLKGRVLELASGTGDLLLLIQNEFDDAYGLDIDSNMLLKAYDKGCYNLLVLDMLKMKTLPKFDTLICVGDSINYLQENELDCFFENVKEVLNPNGHFIFDMHHTSRLTEFEELYIEEADMGDYQYQWTIQTDENDLIHQFVFYQESDTIIETIVQHVFDELLIQKLLSEKGLVVEQKFISDESEKVMYWCKKR